MLNLTCMTLLCMNTSLPLNRSCAMASEQQIPSRKLQICSAANSGVSPYWRENCEREAHRYWDAFYKRHQNKVGCGAGNTIFPIIASYPDAFVFACDFSPLAIDLVKSHKDYKESCASAFISDLTADDLSKDISPSSVDIVTLIFMLSAVSPEKMPLVLQNIRKVMKPNGYVLFRDYAVGDHAQEKFSAKDQKISDNFYVRGDGTRAYYFSSELFTNLFKENGFDVEEIGVYCKKVENRSRELVMNRHWLRAVFCLSNGSNYFSSKEAPPKVSCLHGGIHAFLNLHCLFHATSEEFIGNPGSCKDKEEPALIIAISILRQVDEPSLISAAAKFGFKFADKWPSSLSSNLS
ncbi:uncharacterized protein LOC129302519 isoform X2 [Prosopis cineraria]|uniref:uncharacterized protein LOC129302519 isoform X2 n=1 Tax=Prosopis cineraria TaxID=364024 RepID=UPI00241084E5|nr:uncharacterized protein LOC129302519 isoform X2 [Prosopis cineraria]